MRPIQFAIQSYRHESLQVSAQRLVNGYAEVHPRGSKAPVSVHGFPGIDTFATVGSGPIRAMFEQNEALYVVSRDSLYSVDSSGTETLLGVGIGGIDVLSIDGNSNQVVTVNGTNGYIYDETTEVFDQITDGQFKSARTVTSLDSYFVFDWKGTRKFFISNLDDGSSYSALMFAEAESKPDRVLAVKNLDGNLRLLGEKTIEAWDSIGAGTPPFQRFDGATISTRGIAAALAVIDEDEAGWLLGNDRVFYRLAGTSLQRVSTYAIEKIWGDYATVSDAFCLRVPTGGHKFIYVTFPTEGTTWGYDISTGLWHERISWDSSGAEIRWRANCSIDVFNKVLIGDANSGRIGYLSSTTYTEFGDPVRFIMVAPPIFDPGGRKLSMSMLEVDIQAGVGITTGQGSDPQIMLDWSDDGGVTWSEVQLWRSMGKIGENSVRLQWDRLGSFYQRVLRLQISDPVKRTIIAARGDIELA